MKKKIFLGWLFFILSFVVNATTFTPDRKDKDVAEFLDKIDQLLAGKSEYQFEPIVLDK